MTLEQLINEINHGAWLRIPKRTSGPGTLICWAHRKDGQVTKPGEKTLRDISDRLECVRVPGVVVDRELCALVLTSAQRELEMEGTRWALMHAEDGEMTDEDGKVVKLKGWKSRGLDGHEADYFSLVREDGSIQ